VLYFDIGARTHRLERTMITLVAILLLSPVAGPASQVVAARGAVAPASSQAAEAAYDRAERLMERAVELSASEDSAARAESLKVFRQAHEAYLAVLAGEPAERHVAGAARGQMEALRGALEYDESGAKRRACVVNAAGQCNGTDRRKTTTADRFEVTPYAPGELEMLAAYDVYEQHIHDPSGPQQATIRYHRCKLMLAHNRLDEVAPKLEALIKDFDGTIQAVWASEMLIDVLTIQWTDPTNTPKKAADAGDALERWAREIAGRKTAGGAEAARLRQATGRLIAAVGWRRAEHFQAQGKAGDTKAFVACGEQYVSVFNEFPDHDRADIMAFNAARCFEAGLSLGRAIQLRRLILARFGSSSVHSQTLIELAYTYQAIAQFEEAATHLERFSVMYAKDERTESALHNAVIFRVALGDKAKAKENLDRYERLYRRKDPKKAAGIFWSGHEQLSSDAERLSHAQQYLKLYGSKGGVDRRVVAEAAAGEILWRQSCSRQLPHESCVSIERSGPVGAMARRTQAVQTRSRSARGPIPRRCGIASGDTVTVHPRNKQKAAQAQSHFSAVRKLAERAPKLPRSEGARQSAFNDAVAKAMVYTADREYEAYLRVQLPADLEFYVDPQHRSGDRKHAAQVAKRADSEKRFREFLQRKTRAGQDLIEDYAALTEVRSPGWTLAAASRTAVLSDHFAEQLARADVPRSIKTHEQYEAYCGALGDASAGPKQLAVEAYATCVDWSTQLGYFNEFSRMCEDALHRADPANYPATHELLGTATYTRSVMDVAGVQTDATLPAAALPSDDERGN